MPVIWRTNWQLTDAPGARLTGTSKHPLPPESSRSPNLSSTTFVIATFTVDVFVIRTEKVTGPPGSLIEVGLAYFSTLIEPWPTVSWVAASVSQGPSPAV